MGNKLRIIVVIAIAILFITTHEKNEQPLREASNVEQRGEHVAKNKDMLVFEQISPTEAVKEAKKAIQPSTRTLTVEATYYTARCKGCSGITYTGLDVRNTIHTKNGRGVIAVDPNVIPLGSIVRINGKEYKASDIGSAIKGHKIDILVKTREEALKRGRHDIKIEILES